MSVQNRNSPSWFIPSGTPPLRRTTVFRESLRSRRWCERRLRRLTLRSSTGHNGLVSLTVRRAESSDADFLAEMLVAAAFWRSDGPSGSVTEVLSQPQLAHYVAGWPRAGDLGVIALEAHQAVGAAWVRLLPESDPGYGFVDAATPELSVGVARAWRGRGIGSRLLGALIAAAREQGLASLSLSVEPDNYARHLYERVGFRQVEEVSGSLTMLLRLQPATP